LNLTVDILEENTTQIYHEVIKRMFELLKAPVKQPEMFWIIVPVIISMVLVAYYFGKYKQEELGWNTAFGNGVVMLFVCVDLLRYLSNNHLLGSNVQTYLVVAVLIESILLTILNFLHALPKSFAFGLSSGITVNCILLFLIVVIYSKIPLDYITAIAVAVLSLIIVVALRLMQILEWPADEED